MGELSHIPVCDPIAVDRYYRTNIPVWSREASLGRSLAREVGFRGQFHVSFLSAISIASCIFPFSFLSLGVAGGLV